MCFLSWALIYSETGTGAWGVPARARKSPAACCQTAGWSAAAGRASLARPASTEVTGISWLGWLACGRLFAWPCLSTLDSTEIQEFRLLAFESYPIDSETEIFIIWRMSGLPTLCHDISWNRKVIVFSLSYLKKVFLFVRSILLLVFL